MNNPQLFLISDKTQQLSQQLGSTKNFPRAQKSDLDNGLKLCNEEDCKPTTSNEVDCLQEVSADDAAVASPFVRSYRVADSSPSKLSRLSLAIRRSLNIGSSRRKPDVSQREIIVQEGEAAPFTEFTALRPEVFIQPRYGDREYLLRLINSKQINHLKHFLRQNNWPITHEIRKDLWTVLVSHNDREFESSKSFYHEQIQLLLRVQNFRPAFLSEPGIVVCDHGLKEIGVIHLQRLLIVIEYAKPEIRFVPQLYPIGAIFLHYHSVEEAYASINRLLNQGNRFILQSELAVFASRYTILALLKKFKKKVFNLLRKQLGREESSKMADVMANWHFWIFKNLPFHYLVRVMDCFLVEGQKMLARVALTLIYLWYKQIHHTVIVKSVKFTDGSLSKGFVGRMSNVSEDRVSDISAEIAVIASKPPVSVQTFLDIGFAIRRFSNNYLYCQQHHYENKFRDRVARQRNEKNRRQTEERIYTIAFVSKIIDEDVAMELISALPPRFQLETPSLIFRLSEHGTSFVHFWSRVEEAEQSILVIRSTNNRIFGAYLSSSWMERKDIRERAKTRYFGTGESFVWRLDEELKLPIFYTWCEQTCDNFFMAASDKFLLIGSGGGDAIAIRDELVEGSSRPSNTFQSPELVPGGIFQIDELEVFNVASTN